MVEPFELILRNPRLGAIILWLATVQAYRLQNEVYFELRR